MPPVSQKIKPLSFTLVMFKLKHYKISFATGKSFEIHAEATERQTGLRYGYKMLIKVPV